MQKNQKGFSSLMIIFILATAVLLGAAGYFIYQKHSSNDSMSFEECSKRYGATKSYPGTCRIPSGKVIIQQIPRSIKN